MKTITTTAGQLEPGDIVLQIKVAVTGIQRIGSLVIVDLADNTATAPVPANGTVKVNRPSLCRCGERAVHNSMGGMCDRCYRLDEARSDARWDARKR
jgi:hypothetical protein